MDIYRLTPREWARLKRLRLAALANAPDAFGSTHQAALSYDEADWQAQIGQLATFVASHDERDVGMARGVADEVDSTTALLVSMWVAPLARGQRVGEQLIDAVADWARRGNFVRLVLDVADDNESALALYARMNFLPTGEKGALPPPRGHILEHRRELSL
jgi:GNAT superfamily N-acetyltransferase